MVYVYIYFYEGESLTRQCMDAIKYFTNSEDYKFVLVDDGSPSNVGEKFRKEGYEVIRHNENRGIPASINTCLKHEGEIKWITQNDVIVSENWLPPLLEFREKHPEFLYISPFAFDGNIILDHIKFNEKIKNIRHIFKDYVYPQYWGGAWLCDHRILDIVGEYDEQFKYFADDCDYTMRIRNAQAPTVSIGCSLVLHKSSSTMSRSQEFKNHLQSNLDALNKKWKGVTVNPEYKVIDGINYKTGNDEGKWNQGMSMKAEAWLK